MNFPPAFPSVSVPEPDSYCFFLEIIDSPAIMHCAHLRPISTKITLCTPTGRYRPQGSFKIT
eukprot:COSAG05_NODE_436_length_9838_cov_49.389876_15_plen_62_part_00